jgi:hypothetical protein
MKTEVIEVIDLEEKEKEISFIHREEKEEQVSLTRNP